MNQTRAICVVLAIVSLAAFMLAAQLVLSYLFVGYGLCPEVGIPVIFFFVCTFGLAIQMFVDTLKVIRPHDVAERDGPKDRYRGNIY